MNRKKCLEIGETRGIEQKLQREIECCIRIYTKTG
jgi:hypothetical protein